MASKLSINHPLVLQGYLEQALGQLEISRDERSDIHKRIHRGDLGGLAYELFADSRALVTKFESVYRPAHFNSIRAYFEATDTYVAEAVAFAARYDFSLLSIKKEHSYSKTLTPATSQSDSPYTTGIGALEVLTEDCLFRFVEMVTVSKEALGPSYMAFLKAGDKFREKGSYVDM